MKIIIAGGRDFNDYELLKSKCDYYFSNQSNIEIVCGKAKGADSLGEKYGIENNIPIKYFPPDWLQYKKSAGFIRNEEMAKYSDALIAFWDEKSKGTKHMITIAKKNNLKTKIIKY